VPDACHPRHTHLEFLAFLKQVAKTYPLVKLHIVCDNYGTHKHPKVQAWLAKNPRVVMHFTPTSGSWLNMVEIFFGIITRQAIRRGTFTSVKDLIAAIEAFIDGWNERCQPFVWTKTADDILAKAHRKQTSNTRHQVICCSGLSSLNFEFVHRGRTMARMPRLLPICFGFRLPPPCAFGLAVIMLAIRAIGD